MPALSIVVVAYRQREALIECLESVVTAGDRTPGEAELIVVDNGGLAGIVRSRFPQARLVEPGSNIGFAGAVQRGIAAAAADWVALVNDDARLEPDALAALIAAGESDARIGSVAAQVRFEADPGRLNSAGIEVDSLGVATERLAGSPVGEAWQAIEVFGPSGACALYRVAMLEQIGGFDERFFAYLEDVDVAWRGRAAGWTSVYEPRAVAYHRASSSSGEGSSFKYELVGRNRVWLLARNATNGQLARALPGILAYDLAYIAYVALTDRTLAPLRGRLAGLRQWRALRARGGPRRQVELGSAWRGWLRALSQHRAYRRLGA